MARRCSKKEELMNKIIIKFNDKKSEEISTSKTSKESTLEDVILSEIRRLQRQIKPEIFRVPKKSRK
jgi:hypothetical protein